MTHNGRPWSRRTAPKASVESVKRISKRRLRLHPSGGADSERPQTRGDCAAGPRPCPWVSCRYHLYLDVHPKNGSIKTNFPHLDLESMPETCSLDVAARGGITLEEVGEVMNLTRERIRQMEQMLLPRVKREIERSWW